MRQAHGNHSLRKNFQEPGAHFCFTQAQQNAKIHQSTIMASTATVHNLHGELPHIDEPHITFFSVSTLCHMLKSAGFALQFCNTAGAEYTYISWLQFHLPHWRWFLQGLLPSPVFTGCGGALHAADPCSRTRPVVLSVWGMPHLDPERVDQDLSVLILQKRIDIA